MYTSPEAERDAFDRWITLALTRGNETVQPPERVWQRIARRISLDRRRVLAGRKIDSRSAMTRPTSF